MPKFNVTFRDSMRAPVKIEAGYAVIVEGHLCFRNRVDGNYPSTQRVFAHGVWADYEQMQPEPMGEGI